MRYLTTLAAALLVALAAVSATAQADQQDDCLAAMTARDFPGTAASCQAAAESHLRAAAAIRTKNALYWNERLLAGTDLFMAGDATKRFDDQAGYDEVVQAAAILRDVERGAPADVADRARDQLQLIADHEGGQ